MSLKGQLFVSFDGPKATGKTTVLEAVSVALKAAGRHQVVNLCEKDLDPYRKETLSYIKELTSNPNRDLERLVCERLADGRAWICENVLTQQPQDCVLLIDRWYPSDAAFRRMIPFAEILQINLDRNVRVPDLLVGVVTLPGISWQRAQHRERGLNSVVIRNLEEHIACTTTFDQAIDHQGWLSCRNEGRVDDAAGYVLTSINALQPTAFGSIDSGRCGDLPGKANLLTRRS